MSSLQPVRGTHDLIGEDSRAHRYIEMTARDTAALYGYDEIATPIFEFTDVFSRTLGDTSDIVTKEMYTFETKGGESVTLRPEGTAGVARAFISNGLAQHVPLKLFYAGPMFRHERPQKGRQRQFHQVGVELIGPQDPAADVEVIALGYQLLKTLKLDNDVKLEINSLGDAESRAKYRSVLVDYLKGHQHALSEDSQSRLTKNPLRILDSKDDADKAIVAEAPSLADHMTDESKNFFRAVTDGLAAIGIPFEVNPNLVRGLDYYCHTAFEFTTTTLGSQGTVLAGGRYDGLIEQMGGPSVPGTGWAAGIERLAMMADIPPLTTRPVAVVPVSEELGAKALELTQSLRNAGIASDLAFSGNMKRRLKRADKINAHVALILGEDELKAGTVTAKDLDSGEQSSIAMSDLIETLKNRFG